MKRSSGQSWSLLLHWVHDIHIGVHSHLTKIVTLSSLPFSHEQMFLHLLFQFDFLNLESELHSCHVVDTDVSICFEAGKLHCYATKFPYLIDLFVLGITNFVNYDWYIIDHFHSFNNIIYSLIYLTSIPELKKKEINLHSIFCCRRPVPRWTGTTTVAEQRE